MKKIRLLMIGLAVSALTACSNHESLSGEEPETPVNTTPTFATFHISVPGASRPQSIHSKATDPGLEDEYAVKTLNIFIYDVAIPHTASVASFTTTDGSLQKTATGWQTSTPIKTSKADKYIFAGVNLTAAIINDINSKGLGAFSYKEFPQQVSDLANLTNGFVMFNSTYPTVIAADDLPTTPEEASTSPFQIPVSRVIAKAATFKGQPFVINGGGEMQNITYGWRNINKQFYFIPKIDGGIIKDYNWDNYNESDFVRGEDAIAINPNGTIPTVFSYALENAFNYIPDVSKMGQTTYLSLSGQFKPDEIIKVKSGIATPQKGDDFETVVNPNGYGTFYVVPTSDGISNYFISSTDAQSFATLCANSAPGMPSLAAPYVLSDNTYTNGLCYFHILVNTNATGLYTPFGVYRNQYYRVTVNSIQAPGNPNDNFDKDQPIRPNTLVNVEITVKDWDVVDESTDL